MWLFSVCSKVDLQEDVKQGGRSYEQVFLIDQVSVPSNMYFFK